MKRVVNAIKQFRLRDFCAPFVFLLMLVPSWIFRVTNRIRGRKLWLVAEEGDARDNGYHFYKYVREKHPDDYCFYAIKLESAGYGKAAKLGNVIKWRSLKHWLYYMSANLNISSQKSGNPCPMFWYLIHVTLGLYRNRVFLQHGITKDDSKWIYYNKTKFKYFICGAKKEYDYIKKRFGYPDGSLLLTGFPRWDTLRDVNKEQEQKSIIIMPTWRNWLGGEKNSLFGIKDFKKTGFYQNWNGLLNNEELIKYVESNNIIVYFYPHINMMKFLDEFEGKTKNIHFVSADKDIQYYLSRCSLMITDYSSVSFDFAYLGKPVIYFQFDLEEFRDRQYGEGYFSYRRDGFGDVLMEENDVVENIKYYAERGFKNEVGYEARGQEFFDYHDNKNSKRVYEAIK